MCRFVIIHVSKPQPSSFTTYPSPTRQDNGKFLFIKNNSQFLHSVFFLLYYQCKWLPTLYILCFNVIFRYFIGVPSIICSRNIEWKAGLILGLRPANGRRRYFVMTSLIGCAQTYNQPWKRNNKKRRINRQRLRQNGRHFPGNISNAFSWKYSIIGSDNGLAPTRRQAIVWTNAG